MATATNIVEQGIDRFQSAVDDVQSEIKRLQKDLRARRKKLEKEAEKRVSKLRSDFRKNDLVQRAESFGKDLRKQVEQGVDDMLAALQIATKSDVRKIDRKLSAISKRIKELEGGEAEEAEAS
jgi:predicted adenine nucleotide alpha hydrolase (AANH) superfamily ATPase